MSDPFNIIALDPGGTTGIAMASSGGGDIQWGHDELGPDLHHRPLYEFLLRRAVGALIPLTIVCEKFEFRQNYGPEGNRNKVELISREYIGIVNLVVAQNPDTKLVMQSASMAKSFVSDTKLERSGLLLKPVHPNRHRNDALRHLVRYLVVNLRVRSPITDNWRTDAV